MHRKAIYSNLIPVLANVSTNYKMSTIGSNQTQFVLTSVTKIDLSKFEILGKPGHFER